jgi:hypothetical protein
VTFKLINHQNFKPNVEDTDRAREPRGEGGIEAQRGSKQRGSKGIWKDK